MPTRSWRFLKALFGCLLEVGFVDISVAEKGQSGPSLTALFLPPMRPADAATSVSQRNS
jgi:hypothetical protein